VPALKVNCEPVKVFGPVLETSIVNAPARAGALAAVTVLPLKSRSAPPYTVSVPFTVTDWLNWTAAKTLASTRLLTMAGRLVPVTWAVVPLYV